MIESLHRAMGKSSNGLEELVILGGRFSDNSRLMKVKGGRSITEGEEDLSRKRKESRTELWECL